MAFPEEGQSKFALARAAAAVLATLVIDQGDAAGLLAVSEPTTAGTHYVPARSGRHHLHLCLAELARLTSAGAEGIASGLTRATALLRRRGLVVAISDLYEEDVALAEIRRVSRMGHDVVVVHVMSREELTLPAGGAIEFVDLETGTTVVTNADAVSRGYAANVDRFLTRMQSAITREGLDYLRLVTGEPLEPALRRFLVGRRGGE